MAATVLEDAARLLEDPRDWVRGSFERTRSERHGFFKKQRWTARCTDRAIDVAAEARFGSMSAVAAGLAREQLYDRLGFVGDARSPVSIHRWNDSPDRTHADVVRTLRAAAAL